MYMKLAPGLNIAVLTTDKTKKRVLRVSQLCLHAEQTSFILVKAKIPDLKILL